MSFHFIDVLWRIKLFNFWWFDSFFFLLSLLVFYLRKPCLTWGHEGLMLSSKFYSFTSDIQPGRWSILRVFLYMVWDRGSNYILFACGYPDVQHHLLKRLLFYLFNLFKQTKNSPISPTHHLPLWQPPICSLYLWTWFFIWIPQRIWYLLRKRAYGTYFSVDLLHLTNDSLSI